MTGWTEVMNFVIIRLLIGVVDMTFTELFVLNELVLLVVLGDRCMVGRTELPSFVTSDALLGLVGRVFIELFVWIELGLIVGIFLSLTATQ